MIRKRSQQYRMLTRIVDFGAKYVGLFPKQTVAGDLLAGITTTAAKLPEFATSQVSSHASILTSSRTRKGARLTVKKQMEAILQTARALKMEDFSIPKNPKEEDLIRMARSFAERAEPFKTQFIQHGLPPAFIENLKTSIQALEEALLDRAGSQAGRSGAIREFNKLLDHALNLVDRFEALVDNTLADNELAMAAWKVARQIDRLPQPAKPGQTEPNTQAPMSAPPALPDKSPSAPGQEAAAATA